MTKLQQDVKQYAFESIKGKQLEINQLQLPRRIKIVKNISLGQSHLIAHCVDNFTGDDVIYGMGSNKWGQLGHDPRLGSFAKVLELINIKCLEDGAASHNRF